MLRMQSKRNRRGRRDLAGKERHEKDRVPIVVVDRTVGGVWIVVCVARAKHRWGWGLAGHSALMMECNCGAKVVGHCPNCGKWFDIPERESTIPSTALLACYDDFVDDSLRLSKAMQEEDEHYDLAGWHKKLLAICQARYQANAGNEARH
jgi:hypothetical protein